MLLKEGLSRLLLLLVAVDHQRVCFTTPPWCETPAEQPHFTPSHHQQPLLQLNSASCLSGHLPILILFFHPFRPYPGHKLQPEWGNSLLQPVSVIVWYYFYSHLPPQSSPSQCRLSSHPFSRLPPHATLTLPLHRLTLNKPLLLGHPTQQEN